MTHPPPSPPWVIRVIRLRLNTGSVNPTGNHQQLSVPQIVTLDVSIISLCRYFKRINGMRINQNKPFPYPTHKKSRFWPPAWHVFWRLPCYMCVLFSPCFMKVQIKSWNWPPVWRVMATTALFWYLYAGFFLIVAPDPLPPWVTELSPMGVRIECSCEILTNMNAAKL